MFDKIETKTKTAFTKEYNKQHREITRMPGKKGEKKDPEKVTDQSEKESDSESE